MKTLNGLLLPLSIRSEVAPQQRQVSGREFSPTSLPAVVPTSDCRARELHQDAILNWGWRCESRRAGTYLGQGILGPARASVATASW